MNSYVLILKGCNKRLACLEFETLWQTYFHEEIKLLEVQNVIYTFKSKILDIHKDPRILSRLTFTNYLGDVYFELETLDKYAEEIEKLNLERYEGKSFKIRIKKSRREFKIDFKENTLAKPIWDKFSEPIVNLENPDVEFNLVVCENGKMFFTKKLYENEKEYLERMPKMRPIAKPYTLKSDMARAAINLTKIKTGILLDPFCGIGGILLEAEDMGFKVIGNDISWNDLRDMKINFEHYYPKTSSIKILSDSKTRVLKENSIDAVVTDIPYGKSSRKLGADLYEEFLKNAVVYLKPNSRLIVIYANFVEFKHLALKYFEEAHEIEQYINKSMTRYILILENNK